MLNENNALLFGESGPDESFGRGLGMRSFTIDGSRQLNAFAPFIVASGPHLKSLQSLDLFQQKNTDMKKYKIMFWISTILIFLFQGVMPALTGQTEMAKEGIRHLGYPDYFGLSLTIAKVIGAIILILPMFPARIKEWAYAGFAFDFVFACISLWAVDGFSPLVLFPIVVLAVLMVSYFSYHKLRENKAPQPTGRVAVS